MRITGEWLRRQGACWDDVYKFEDLFPKGVDLKRLKESDVRLALEHDMNVEWLLQFVPEAQKRKYYREERRLGLNRSRTVGAAYGRVRKIMGVKSKSNTYLVDTLGIPRELFDRYILPVRERADDRYDDGITPSLTAAIRCIDRSMLRKKR